MVIERKYRQKSSHIWNNLPTAHKRRILTNHSSQQCQTITAIAIVIINLSPSL